MCASPMELQPAVENSRSVTTHSQTRAEQLLALRAPLIERGKRVSALERSIASHEVEAKALYGLLRTANQAEKILVQERDEALREIDIVRLETDLVRERLRTAETQLAEVRDLSHVKEVAHAEEVSTLRKRCSAMKRKIEYLSTGQRRELENKIMKLEHMTNDFRKELMEMTTERDEWRESAISSEQELKEMRAKQSKAQSLSALLETERTLSMTLHKQLKDAQQTVKNAERENAKLSARDTGKVEKALEAEKGKTTELRQKVKDADTSIKKVKRDESKLRQKCDDLDKRLKEALARAVKSEERAAQLEKRPGATSRGLASPGRDMLMSPAPLAFGKRPAEDMASESRSRFTATLPQGILDDGATDDDESEEQSPSPQKMDSTPRLKRKKAKPRKLAPPRKTFPKRAASSRDKESDSLKGPETKMRRRAASAKESNGPTVQVDSPTASPGQVNVTPSRIATPRRKHGKATRKTTTSSPAKRLRQPPQGEPGEESIAEPGSDEAPRRTLRSRRPVSYNYDEEGRDLVHKEPGFEVDYAALRPVRVTRSTRSQKRGVAAPLELNEPAPGNRIVSPSSVKRSRRMETVRKQVPATRDKVK